MDEPAAKRQKPEVEDLPDELLVEILSRLTHHKYVLQCKCVSKRWLSLITNPNFVIHSVTNLSSANNKMEKQQPWTFIYFKFLEGSIRPSRFVNKADGKKVDSSTLKLVSQFSEFKSRGFSLDLEFLPFYQDRREDDDREPITILNTFNDLILCSGEKFDESECVYYICNPQTQQWVALPPTPPLPLNTKCTEVEFICEPYYYKKNDELIINTQIKFNVLRFLGLSSSKNLKLQIFSSKTGQWRTSQISLPPETIESCITRSLVCKGKLMIVIGMSPNRSFSVITVDDHFSICMA